MTQKAPPPETGIQCAIREAGGVTRLAALLGVHYQRVQHWAKQGYAPRRFIVEIAAQTGVATRRLLDPRLRDLTDSGMGED